MPSSNQSSYDTSMLDGFDLAVPGAELDDEGRAPDVPIPGLQLHPAMGSIAISAPASNGHPVSVASTASALDDAISELSRNRRSAPRPSSGSLQRPTSDFEPPSTSAQARLPLPEAVSLNTQPVSTSSHRQSAPHHITVPEDIKPTIAQLVAAPDPILFYEAVKYPCNILSSDVGVPGADHYIDNILLTAKIYSFLDLFFARFDANRGSLFDFYAEHAVFSASFNGRLLDLSSVASENLFLRQTYAEGRNLFDTVQSELYTLADILISYPLPLKVPNCQSPLKPSSTNYVDSRLQITPSPSGGMSFHSTCGLSQVKALGRKRPMPMDLCCY